MRRTFAGGVAGATVALAILVGAPAAAQVEKVSVELCPPGQEECFTVEVPEHAADAVREAFAEREPELVEVVKEVEVVREVEVPVEVVREVEVIKEVPGPVREVEVPGPVRTVYVEVPVEVIKEVPGPRTHCVHRSPCAPSPSGRI